MATTNIISSTPPPPVPKPGDISSLVSPNTLSNLNSSIAPKAFGDQLKNKAKSTVVAAATQSTIVRLNKIKVDLIQEEILLDLNHQKELLSLNQKNTPAKKVVNGQTVDIPPQLSDEEYQAAVIAEDINYKAAKENIQKKKEANQKDIDDYLNDPFKKQKDAKKKRQEDRNKRQVKTKAEKQKARQKKAKSILANGKKTLVPILTLLLTNKIGEIIAQNDIIQILVDNTNKIIENANLSNEQVQLENAKLSRNNAITVIQNNENKILKISEQIRTISLYIRIFDTIITIISNIPIPTSTGVPGVPGIPINLIMKLVKILDKATKIVLALSALLPLITSSLEKAISILEDYKAQLLPINGIIDTTSALTQTLNTNLTFGTDYGTYKGFKFALKEENNPKFVIRGNKRRYAVAIDKDNVDVLKSDLSFTLDPNDLIEQLKLKIDSLNLSS